MFLTTFYFYIILIILFTFLLIFAILKEGQKIKIRNSVLISVSTQHGGGGNWAEILNSGVFGRIILPPLRMLHPKYNSEIQFLFWKTVRAFSIREYFQLYNFKNFITILRPHRLVVRTSAFQAEPAQLTCFIYRYNLKI